MMLTSSVFTNVMNSSLLRGRRPDLFFVKENGRFERRFNKLSLQNVQGFSRHEVAFGRRWEMGW